MTMRFKFPLLFILVLLILISGMPAPRVLAQSSNEPTGFKNVTL